MCSWMFTEIVVPSLHGDALFAERVSIFDEVLSKHSTGNREQKLSTRELAIQRVITGKVGGSWGWGWGGRLSPNSLLKWPPDMGQCSQICPWLEKKREKNLKQGFLLVFAQF